MYIAKHFYNQHAEFGVRVAPTTTTPSSRQYHITLTDMDGPIQALIQDNIRRNFHECTSTEIELFSEYMKQNHYPLLLSPGSSVLQNPGSATMIEAMVLDWDDYYHSKHNTTTTTSSTKTTAVPGTTTTDSSHPPPPAAKEASYDIVFGSDIVATLYDPIKLAYTIYDLCHSQSVVYISYKERLRSIHSQFQNTLTQLFQCVTIFHASTGRIIYDTSSSTGSCSDSHSPDNNNNHNHHHSVSRPSSSSSSSSDAPWTSRNRNPNVYIIVASHRIVCPATSS